MQLPGDYWRWVNPSTTGSRSWLSSTWEQWWRSLTSTNKTIKACATKVWLVLSILNNYWAKVDESVDDNCPECISTPHNVICSRANHPTNLTPESLLTNPVEESTFTSPMKIITIKLINWTLQQQQDANFWYFYHRPTIFACLSIPTWVCRGVSDTTWLFGRSRVLRNGFVELDEVLSIYLGSKAYQSKLSLSYIFVHNIIFTASIFVEERDIVWEKYDLFYFGFLRSSLTTHRASFLLPSFNEFQIHSTVKILVTVDLLAVELVVNFQLRAVSLSFLLQSANQRFVNFSFVRWNSW